MSGRVRYVAEIAEDYRDKGWSVFPLPAGQKMPPKKGVTGYNARLITDEDYESWRHEWRNIGLVMPDGVIGIDADIYKHGGAALRLLEDLPPTIRSTNRDDGSGIYLFRTPKGMKFKGTIEGVGEVIQRIHRYGVVWPSVHPSGRIYKWVDDDDREVEIPDIGDIPDLPDEWLKKLQDRSAKSTRKSTGKRPTKGYDGDTDEWLDALPTGPMSPQVRSTVRNTIRSLRRYSVRGDCRYDVMVKGVGRLVNLGARRQRGVGQALDDLIDEYIAALKDEPDRNPYSELDRAIIGAVEKWGSK